MEENMKAKEKTTTNEHIDFDQLAVDLGGFGRYQKVIFMMACIVSFFNGMGPVINVFTSYTTSHRCFVPSCDTKNSSYEDYFTNYTTPFQENSEEYEKCSMNVYSGPNDNETDGCDPMYFSSNETTSCQSWVYDTEVFRTTLVTDFNLVCKRAFLAPLSGSSFMIGEFIGAIVSGFICDKYGRKMGLLICLAFYALGGVGCAVVPNYPSYLFLNMLSGAGCIGTFQAVLVIVLELLPLEWRTFCGILLEIPFAIGEVTVGVLAYFIRQWRWLEVACSAPSLLLIWSYWVFPESIRWLQSKDRVSDALKEVDRVAKFNRISSPTKVLAQQFKNENSLKNVAEERKKTSLLILMKSKNMRKKSLILFYCWMVCSLVFFGLANNTGNLPGSIFVSFICNGLVELPANIVVYFMLLKVGRKGTLSIVFIVGGLACLLSGLLPSDMDWAIVSLSLFGKFNIGGAFSSIFIYTVELYSTDYRGIGVGACSMFSRIGGILAPIISSLASVYQPLPLLIFGMFAFIAGFLIILLPETLGKELPQTLEESESFASDQGVWYFSCCDSQKKDEEENLS